MQTKIVSVGIDTLKVNPKAVGDDGKLLQYKVILGSKVLGLEY